MAVVPTPSYKRLHDGSKRMHAIILNTEADDSLAIKAVEGLIACERFKREMRGIPSLKPVELKDAPQRQRRAPRAQSVKPIAKESLSKPQTVTTPPAVMGESSEP